MRRHMVSPDGPVREVLEYRTISRTRWALVRCDSDVAVANKWVRCDALTTRKPETYRPTPTGDHSS